MDEIQKIYVRLLDEGTETFTGALAKPIGSALYEIVATDHYDPEDQQWEFLPGTKVRLEEVTVSADGKPQTVLAATHPDPRAIRVSVRTQPEHCEPFYTKTYAIHLGEGRYELQATPHYKNEENWDFLPSSVVRLRERKSHGFDWIEAYDYAG